MKTIILIILTILIFSCQPEPTIIDPVSPYESELLGTWNRNDLAWDFYANGEFMYYEWDTKMMNNYGFYLDDPAEGIFYVEDYISGLSVYYLYSIDSDVLSMAPDFAPGNVTEWGRVR